MTPAKTALAAMIASKWSGMGNGSSALQLLLFIDAFGGLGSLIVKRGPKMTNRISHQNRQMILRMLCEGNSIRSTSRVTGHHKNTVERVIREFGSASSLFMDDVMRDLTLTHLELDEMWTFVAKKQKRLTVEEKAARYDIGDVYLWTALDQPTKLIPSFIVGKRSADNARRFLMDLAGRLTFPTPNESDGNAYQQGAYRPVIQLSTDAFAAYPEAVDLAFGPYADYGQVKKEFRSADMPGRYAPAEIIATERRVIKGDISPWSICTSHIERHNLTVRTFMKRFTRLALGFSKKLECLKAACAMFLAYYNFVWRTRYPDKSGRAGKLRPTAAMMAGVTERLWNFSTFYDTVLYYG